jgi:hypothetical protein
MRVRINEARHHDAMSGIDHFTIAADQTFDFASPPYSVDVLAAHEHGAIFNDRELAQVSARPRPPGPRQRDQLGTINDGKSFSHEFFGEPAT